MGHDNSATNCYQCKLVGWLCNFPVIKFKMWFLKWLPLVCNLSVYWLGWLASIHPKENHFLKFNKFIYPTVVQYDQIKILTSKEQSCGFSGVYKYVPSYMYRHSIFQMPKCLRRGNARTLQFKPRQKFWWKHLYQKIKFNNLSAKYDIPANTISTWKKNKNMLINI